MSDSAQREPSLSERAYAQLRDQIIRGALRPNERLVEGDLAARLGISRTPVRDGLLRLAAEGLVHRDRAGWVVHEHTREEIRSLYEVRAPLEGYAAFLAAQRASAEELKNIEALLPEAGPAGQVSAELAERDTSFHLAIATASGNQRLVDAIRQAGEFYFTYRLAGLFYHDPTVHSASDHAALVDALVARDPGRAEEITRRHLLDSLDMILARLP